MVKLALTLSPILTSIPILIATLTLTPTKTWIRTVVTCCAILRDRIVKKYVS